MEVEAGPRPTMLINILMKLNIPCLRNSIREGGSIDIYRGCPLEDGEIPVVFRFSNGRVEIPNKDYVAWDLDDKFNTCACLTSLFTCSLLNYNSSIIPSSEDTIEAGRLIPLSECTKYGDPLFKSDRIYFLTVKNGEVQSISHFRVFTESFCVNFTRR